MSSGIILGELSEHYPYFVCVDNLFSARVKPPRQAKQRINPVKAMENMLNDMKAADIDKDLNKDLLADPSENYDILHERMKFFKDKHLPNKFVKYHKHRYQKNKWITFGILQSIKCRDIMYIRYKQCPHNTPQHMNLKNNLRVFNAILKSTIREAKIQHYNQLFHKYRSDIKMTLKCISEILCKSSGKRNKLEKIILESKTIKN